MVLLITLLYFGYTRGMSRMQRHQLRWGAALHLFLTTLYCCMGNTIWDYNDYTTPTLCASLGTTTGTGTSFCDDAMHPGEAQLPVLQLQANDTTDTTHHYTNQPTNQRGFCNSPTVFATDTFAIPFCSRFCNYSRLAAPPLRIAAAPAAPRSAPAPAGPRLAPAPAGPC